MKIGFVLQAFTVLYQYKMAYAIYGFGVIKKPVFLPPQHFYGKQVTAGIFQKPSFALEDIRIKPEPVSSYFGGYLSEHPPVYGHSHAASTDSLLQPQIKQSPVAYGKLVRPILLLPNGWIQGVNVQEDHNIKPVTEEHPDDLKFDFRTRTHSFR